MAKEVLCPICGAAYNLADEQLGKKVRCKKCEHAFTAGGEQKRRHDEDDEDDEAPRRKTRAKKGRGRDDDEKEKKPKKTKTLEEQAKPRGQRDPGLPVSSFVIMGVVLAVIVLCCGGGGLFWWLVSSARPPHPNPRPPNKRGEAPAAGPAVAWLHDAAGVRRRAGAAARLADLVGRQTNRPTGRSPWA